MTDNQRIIAHQFLAEYRNAVIEECKRALTNVVCLHCGSDNTDRLIKALEALKE